MVAVKSPLWIKSRLATPDTRRIKTKGLLSRGLTPLVLLPRGLAPLVLLLRGLAPLVLLPRGLAPLVLLLSGPAPLVLLPRGHALLVRPIKLACQPCHLSILPLFAIFAKKRATLRRNVQCCARKNVIRAMVSGICPKNAPVSNTDKHLSLDQNSPSQG